MEIWLERVLVPLLQGDRGAIGDMEIEMSSQCLSCKHFDREKPITCEAFPDGVPAEVLNGRFDHTQPFDGDHGIRFEE